MGEFLKIKTKKSKKFLFLSNHSCYLLHFIIFLLLCVTDFLFTGTLLRQNSFLFEETKVAGRQYQQNSENISHINQIAHYIFIYQ